MKKIAVYCGASTGNDNKYEDATIELGKWLVNNNFELIYGGGGVGLMGLLTQTVLDNGGKAHGIMPQNLYDRGAAHSHLTSLEIVPNMSVRKQYMLDRSDACIALPGGPGTLEEIIEAFSWARLGDNDNPCILYNVDRYYDPLKHMFTEMTKKGFLTEIDFNKLGFLNNLSDIMTFIETYNPPKIREYKK
ncbi:TIGR00730 family Rossman fold protein [Leuconostoc fallax]|uniref:Cytokinin riboside 5'-monophosphate phosphoribohydrolase n=1 Tax=Leuconostoc fallax TaxID=1251 RepID=A0A4R5NBE8_9LACO|nr:TIGR00730 family Rossman fold protein [Leuconostoc fallax]MBU7456420.1 TIGR00730 family Rossman fold protein [Leuconostoc fallax]TDG69421.1 hypothetical protein C5L23_000883 [Leuconostoc fallax]